MSQVTVALASLGLCEHCGVLLTIQDLPTDALDASWTCPKCGQELSHRSFGYSDESEKAQKILWVGSDGKWMDKKPEESFNLGEWYVTELSGNYFLY